MDTVGSTRLGRASSRYGAPAVFSGPVRKWEKKWVHVSPSSFNNNKNSNASSRLLLRRWTPVTNRSSAEEACDVSDEPPRRKFRYTPIAVLEEQKKGAVEKVEKEPTIETDQLTDRQTNVNREVHRKLNMNEISEDSKDSNMSKVDLGLDFQGNNGENSQNSDDPVGGP
ncbi:unnamed protein product [Lathyrus oleraceus]|uniref:Uncharacterized protein n=1 Tax=Pisum sativum TaxID=3888 RepID=A0A9D5AKN8_PEA|nr:uncharacterized protein LOC127084849 [Pisum sativum]KAI5409235.1 hypothetical protein KIW84_054874 [Pisum sativum]